MIREDVDLLYVYGGEVNDFTSWLASKDNRRIVFLDCDEKQFLFSDSRISFYCCSKDNINVLAKELARKNAMMPMQVVAVEPGGEELLHALEVYHHVTDIVMNDYCFHGVDISSNIVGNYRKMRGSYDTEGLVDAFRGCPAIICGGGPSLLENIGALGGDEALIFAGGSAINACSDNGIVPHFNLAIDPNDEEYHFFLRHNCFEVPLLWRGRINTAALMLSHSLRLFVHGVAGYPIARWLEEVLGFCAGQELLGGHSVSTLATRLAVMMGCNPIIFVGIDLAVVGDSKYAWNPGFRRDNYINKVDGGRDILIKEDWRGELSWYTDFIKEHPNVEFINTSFCGQEIPGALRRAWDDLDLIKADYCGGVHAAIQNLRRINFSEGDFNRGVDVLTKSIERCIELIDKILASPCRGALLEVELYDTPAYKNILGGLYAIYDVIFSRYFKGEDELLVKNVGILVELREQAYQYLNMLNEVMNDGRSV